MWLKIAEVIVKIIGAILCVVMLTVALVCLCAVSLIDGLRWGYWHGDDWDEVPELLDNMVEHFKTPIFD